MTGNIEFLTSNKNYINKPKYSLDIKLGIPEIKEVIVNSQERREKLNLDILRAFLGSNFGKEEGFEKGIEFLSKASNIDVNNLGELGKNCNYNPYTTINVIKNWLINSKFNDDVFKRLSNYIEEEGFFGDNLSFNNFINHFLSEIIDYLKQEKVSVEQEKVSVEQEKVSVEQEKVKTKNEKIVKAFEKINSNERITSVSKEILNKNGLKNIEEFLATPQEKQKEIILELLSQIHQEAIKEKNPEKKKELENLFTSVSTDFVSAGIISHGEIALIRQKIENDINISESRFKPEGYKSYDNGNTLIKNEKGTNEIITFDSSGNPSEKIASSSTGYEVKLSSSTPLFRDIAIIESKINKVKSALDGAINNYKDILRNSGLLISLRPEYILQVLAKNPQDITQEKEREIYKELKGSEKIIIEINDIIKTLELKLKKFEDRRKEYEKQKEQNKDKLEDINKQKDQAKNKILILDSIGITQLPQNYTDEILKHLENPDLKIFDKGIDFGIKETKDKLKEIFAKILGKTQDEIYEKNSNNLKHPYNERKGLLDGLSNPPPGVYKDGIFSPEGLKARLSQKKENSPKN